MPVSNARKRATRKWDEAHRKDYWRCTVMLPVAEKGRVSGLAAARGMTVSEYIRDLIEKDAASIAGPCKKDQEG